MSGLLRGASRIAAVALMGCGVTLGAQVAPVLTVEVRRVEDGSPIEGAQLTLSLANTGAADGLRAVTGTAGESRFRIAAAGEAKLSVRRLGFLPLDTVIAVRADAPVRIEVRLQSVARILGTALVREDLQCPTGFGRLTDERTLAKLLLDAVAPTLEAEDTVAWLVTRVDTEYDAGGRRRHSLRQTISSAEPPMLESAPPAVIDERGFAWSDGRAWHFELPHPADLSAAHFQRRHCFSDRTSGLAEREASIDFVPQRSTVPGQLAGRLVFAGVPRRLDRIDLYYVRTAADFGDSLATAELRFGDTGGQRLRLVEWAQRLPVLSLTTENPLGPLRVRVLPAQVERFVETRVTIASSRRPEDAELARISTEVDCSAISLLSCLDYGHANWARDPSSLGKAAAHYEAACRGGPASILGRSASPVAEWDLLMPPDSFPTDEFFQRSWSAGRRQRLSPADSATLDRMVQHEACVRLVEALRAEPRLDRNGVDPGALALELCARGEAMACVLAAGVNPVSHIGASTSDLEVPDTRRVLVRACYLRAAVACRALARTGPVEVVERLPTFRFRSTTATEPVERLLRSTATELLSRAPVSGPPERWQRLAGRLAPLVARFPRGEVVHSDRGVVLTLASDKPRGGVEDSYDPVDTLFLTDLGRIIAAEAGIRVSIIFHADSGAVRPFGRRHGLENQRSNFRFENARAGWTRRFSAIGVHRRTLRFQMVGDKEPLYLHTSGHGRQLNRRVEVVMSADR